MNLITTDIVSVQGNNPMRRYGLILKPHTYAIVRMQGTENAQIVAVLGKGFTLDEATSLIPHFDSDRETFIYILEE